MPLSEATMRPWTCVQISLVGPGLEKRAGILSALDLSGRSLGPRLLQSKLEHYLDDHDLRYSRQMLHSMHKLAWDLKPHANSACGLV